MHAGHYGAKSVLRLDISETAVAQASDHPIVWGMENTEYLKSLIVEVK